MAKKQTTPKPVAKAPKVTPTRLKQVADSVFMKAGANMIAGNKLAKSKGMNAPIDKKIGARMIKASDKQYATAEKYNAQLKAQPKKEVKGVWKKK